MSQETFKNVVEKGQKAVCSLCGGTYSEEEGTFSHDCSEMKRTFKFQNKPLYKGQHIIPGEDPGHYDIVDSKAKKTESEEESVKATGSGKGKSGKHS